LEYKKTLSKKRALLFGITLTVTLALFAFLIITNKENLHIYTAIIITTACSYGILLHKFEKKSDINFSLIDIEGTLRLADKTFVYLKNGLDSESALFIAKIIKDISNVSAVAITDKKNVLTFIGDNCEKHMEDYPVKSHTVLDVISDGKARIANDRKEFDCFDEEFSHHLKSAVFIPLFDRKEIVGCLNFYETSRMTEESAKLAAGIGKLLSMQIELASYDKNLQLNTEAKLDALQAQINPHFLFNTLNTIRMYINKDTKYARQLIVSLATTLRYLLGKFGRFITLEKEISYIKDYIEIEKARYVDRMTIDFFIPEDIDNIEVPVLCIQPIVHNAITHGILPKDGMGRITIKITRTDDELNVLVKDNGIGMTEGEVKNAYKGGYGSGCGIGISNVNERLKLLYGEDHGVKINSVYMRGTSVSFSIPIGQGEDK